MCSKAASCIFQSMHSRPIHIASRVNSHDEHSLRSSCSRGAASMIVSMMRNSRYVDISQRDDSSPVSLTEGFEMKTILH